jgi:pimeloyl-ACP methyl ester carboxylesterase
MPEHTKFAYTFDRFGDLVDGLLDQLKVTRYAMYVMDYGAPVGWRLALKHPDRVTGLIVQNGNAYEEGLKEFWDPIKAYWSDHSEAHRKALNVLVTPETTKFQYTDGVSDLTRISPDNWVHDQALLDRPRQSRYPDGSLLRLSNQLAAASSRTGVFSRSEAADDKCLGQERQDFSRRWSASMQARSA